MIFTKFLFHKLLGWKINGHFHNEIKKAVVIAVPHTSWHDFYVGAFTRRITKTEINWIGKKELFTWPFGAYFRWMGGTPIDRTPGQNKVEAIAEIYDSKAEFRLSIAPEGTRKKVAEWRTGYYYIAMAAKVPILAVALDYSSKTVTIHPPFYPTGNIEKDTIYLRSLFKDAVGKVPKYT